MQVGGEIKSLAPDDSFTPDQVDFEGTQLIKIGHDERKMVEINPFKGKHKDVLKVDVVTEAYSMPVFLHLDYSKVTKTSRVIVIYTPYVVFNRTGLDLVFKEYNKVLLYKANQRMKSFSSGIKADSSNPHSRDSNPARIGGGETPETLLMFSPS